MEIVVATPASRSINLKMDYTEFTELVGSLLSKKRSKRQQKVLAEFGALVANSVPEWKRTSHAQPL